MKILSDSALLGLEFGRMAVRVDDLQRWALQDGAGLPPTLPDAAEYDVVQLEALLQAIQVGATPVEPAGGKAEVRWAELRIMEAFRTLPPREDLAQLRSIIEDAEREVDIEHLVVGKVHEVDGSAVLTVQEVERAGGADVGGARLFIGIHAGLRWRDRLRAGIASQAFQVVDCADLTPIAAPACAAVAHDDGKEQAGPLPDLAWEGDSYPSPVRAPAEQPVDETHSAAPEQSWVDEARAVAIAFAADQAAKDLYPPQDVIADYAAATLRKRGIVGASGKPVSGATVKRHALKGISSQGGKLRAVEGKRGK